MGAAYLLAPPLATETRISGEQEFKLTGCTGRVCFVDGNTAHAVIKRRFRNHNVNGGQLYRCRQCGNWHVGGKQQ